VNNKLKDAQHFKESIAIYVEMLVDDEMRKHAYAHPTEHELDFQIYRLLCGYAQALDERKNLILMLEKLNSEVNRVTATWRHQKRVESSDMDELVERQIEIEESVEKLLRN
jgi:hypothetical protein